MLVAFCRVISREAARRRRRVESDVFGDLSRLLPLQPSIRAHLDKPSVIRLTLSYIRMQALLKGEQSCSFFHLNQHHSIFSITFNCMKTFSQQKLKCNKKFLCIADFFLLNRNRMIIYIDSCVIYIINMKRNKGNLLGVRQRKYYIRPRIKLHEPQPHKNTPHPLFYCLHCSHKHNSVKTQATLFRLCGRNRSCWIRSRARKHLEIPPWIGSRRGISLWVWETEAGIHSFGWNQHVPEDPGGLPDGPVHRRRYDLLIGQRQQIHGLESGGSADEMLCSFDDCLILKAWFAFCLMADWADGAQHLWVHSPMWSWGDQT